MKKEMMPGIKTFIFPRRYIQGPGTLRVSGKQIAIYMKKALVMGGKRALAAIEEGGLLKSLEEAGVGYHIEQFGKDQPWGPECCEPEIDRLVKIAQENGCDGVIGAGGGKSIDAAKAVADKIGGEVVIIPTIAATDAPTSALSVIYTTDHVFKEYWFYDKNPAAVIIDSTIIAKAPARYLASGMGDAGSKKFEVEACVRSGAKNLAIKPEWIGCSTDLALLIAREQYSMLLEYGELAMDACRRKVVTPALEKIIEVNVLWSGLSFESGGLAAAHSIYNGLTAIEHLMEPEKVAIHGEGVNFGTCVQLLMEDRPKDEVIQHYVWSHKVGLSTTFEHLGFKPGEPSDENLWKAAEKACAAAETIQTMFMFTHGAKEEVLGPYKHKVNLVELVFECMKYADELGRKVEKEVPRRPYEPEWEAYWLGLEKKPH